MSKTKKILTPCSSFNTTMTVAPVAQDIPVHSRNLTSNCVTVHTSTSMSSLIFPYTHNERLGYHDIGRWKVTFDGRSGVVDFLERMKRLT